jgi:hypothetical protein
VEGRAIYTDTATSSYESMKLLVITELLARVYHLAVLLELVFQLLLVAHQAIMEALQHGYQVAFTGVLELLLPGVLILVLRHIELGELVRRQPTVPVVVDLSVQVVHVGCCLREFVVDSTALLFEELFFCEVIALDFRLLPLVVDVLHVTVGDPLRGQHHEVEIEFAVVDVLVRN